MNLTNDRRDRIVGMLLQYTFDKEREELDKQRAKLGPKIYNAAFSASDRKKMKALPKSWLRHKSHITAEIAGTMDRFDMPEAVPFPYDKASYNDCALTLDGSHPIASDYLAYKQANEDLSERRKQAKNEANAVLYAHRTVKQLIDAWPEIKPFVERVCDLKGNRSVPVVPTQQLNKRFRLPIKKKAA